MELPKPLRTLEPWLEQVRDCAQKKLPLQVYGGDTKRFYGGQPQGDLFNTRLWRGVISYEPSELYIQARAGTALSDIEETLAKHGQMLAFEPPHFGEGSTLGGCVATGLGGPRQYYHARARDVMLGVNLIDGRGRFLRFGGQVVKNVAGYDVSRFMVGAMGTLGLMTEITLKVHPKPDYELTVAWEMNAKQAVAQLSNWALLAIPLSASAWHKGRLTVRLSGFEQEVKEARGRLGGEVVADGDAFWRGVREQLPTFFTVHAGSALWRMSQPVQAPLYTEDTFIEAGGIVRWVCVPIDDEGPRRHVHATGGAATLFRGGDKTPGVFQYATSTLNRLHDKIQSYFDPQGIFNPGRLAPMAVTAKATVSLST